MSYGLAIVAVLILSIAVLFVAVMLFRHQRQVAEIKAAFFHSKKQRNFFHQRYLTYQADLDRLRVSYNSMMKELLHIKSEMTDNKNEIKEILEILKEETRGVDDQMSMELSRIIDRRKSIVKQQWQAFNGRKALLIEKMNRVLAEKANEESLIQKKDEAFAKLTELNAILARIKKDFDRIVRSPIISFGKKTD